MEIVLLHGFAQSAKSWDCVLPLLEEYAGAVVHAYEFPGHGLAACPEEPSAYSMESVCDDLLSYLSSFSEPPVVVGYSMGGRIAVSTLYRWLKSLSAFGSAESLETVPPVSALVLESAGLGLTDDESRRAVAERNASWAALLRDEGVAAFMDYWEGLPLFASQRNLPDETRRRIREGRLANDAEALALTLEGTGAHRMPLRQEVDEMLAELARRGMPLLYLAGSFDGKYVEVAESVRGYSNAEVLLDLNEGKPVSVAVVSCCGHNVHEENPHAYAEEIASFLKECNV